MEQPVHRALADALDRKTVRQRHCDTAANSPDRRASSVQARAPPPTPNPLRPPPGRRKRPEGTSLEDSESSSSGVNGAYPRRLDPSPPRPMARTSVAAHRRRARSSRTGRNTTNLDRSVSTIASMTSSMTDPHQKTIYFGENPNRRRLARFFQFAIVPPRLDGAFSARTLRSRRRSVMTRAPTHSDFASPN